MLRRKEKVFHFNSLLHPGCRVYVPGQSSLDVEVHVERSIETCQPSDEGTPDTVTVHGQLFGWRSELNSTESGKQRRTSLNVEVRAYDPIADKNYLMTILDVAITDSSTGKFTARAVKRWHQDTRMDEGQGTSKTTETTFKIKGLKCENCGRAEGVSLATYQCRLCGHQLSRNKKKR